MGIIFRKEHRGRIAAGEITITYRLWQRAFVKAGGSYETGFGIVDVDDVHMIPTALVPEADLPLAGCDTIDAIWASAAEHKQATITPDTLCYRVAFRFRRNATSQS